MPNISIDCSVTDHVTVRIGRKHALDVYARMLEWDAFQTCSVWETQSNGRPFVEGCPENCGTFSSIQISVAESRESRSLSNSSTSHIRLIVCVVDTSTFIKALSNKESRQAHISLKDNACKKNGPAYCENWRVFSTDFGYYEFSVRRSGTCFK